LYAKYCSLHFDTFETLFFQVEKPTIDEDNEEMLKAKIWENDKTFWQVQEEMW
jgi:hypothetical protein